MAHFPQTRIFWGKSLILFSFTYWSLSLCKIKKKNLTADPELCGCTIFGLKMAHLPKQDLFQKTCSFTPIYNPKIKVRYQSSNEILRLKNTDISLGESHFGHNLRTRFFPGMHFLQNIIGPLVISFYTNSRQN